MGRNRAKGRELRVSANSGVLCSLLENYTLYRVVRKSYEVFTYDVIVYTYLTHIPILQL